MNNVKDSIDVAKLKPWNSKDNPIKVNSIRFNHDFTLLTLGTSKGYRIFLLSNLLLVQDETETVDNLGDINIAMTYFSSNLVFLLPSKYNSKFTSKELVLFDDYHQKTLATYKEKKEDIINFFVGKNIVYIVSLTKIVSLEISTFKIIEIIEKVNISQKLLSFNFFDFIAYTHTNEKKIIHVKFYVNEKNRIKSSLNYAINTNFEFIQAFQLSPSGQLLGVVSIFGNKIHIYYTQTGQLKECIYLGPGVQTMEKITFSEKNPNYIFILKLDYKFYIYKIGKGHVNNPKCYCDKYDDKSIVKEIENTDFKGNNLFGFMKKKSKNKDIKEIHAYAEYSGIIFFADFDRKSHKDIILINNKGVFNKYHFNKKKIGNGNISPLLTVQWM